MRTAAVDMIACAYLDARENADDMVSSFEYDDERRVWLLDGVPQPGGRTGYAFEAISQRDPYEEFDYVGHVEAYRRDFGGPVVSAATITTAEMRLGLLYGLIAARPPRALRVTYRRGMGTMRPR